VVVIYQTTQVSRVVYKSECAQPFTLLLVKISYLLKSRYNYVTGQRVAVGSRQPTAFKMNNE
jgi:hypothetical protein